MFIIILIHIEDFSLLNAAFRNAQLMKEVVGAGEELMPHRFPEDLSNNSQPEETSATISTTPIRKFSRNSLVIRKQPVGTDNSRTIAEDSAECDYAVSSADIRKGKRKVI